MGLKASSANLGVRQPEELDIDIIEPKWMDQKLWVKKFKNWQAVIEKGCIAKKGQGGRYCSWVGMACHYNGCPRRIFEYYVELDEIPRPTPTQDFVAEFKTLQNQFAKMQKHLKKANERIKELEDQKK